MLSYGTLIFEGITKRYALSKAQWAIYYQDKQDKQHRAIATRYEKTARSFLAIHFFASVIWLACQELAIGDDTS